MAEFNIFRALAKTNAPSKLNKNTENSILSKSVDILFKLYDGITNLGNKISTADPSAERKRDIDTWSSDVQNLLNSSKLALRQVTEHLNRAGITIVDDELTSDADSVDTLDTQLLELKQHKDARQKERDALDNERLIFNRERSEFENRNLVDSTDASQRPILNSAHTQEIPLEGKPRNLKLDSNLKSFDGRQDVAKWLFVADTAMKNAQIPDNMQVSIITPYLKGLPLEYLVRFVKEGNNSWDEFKKLLTKLFTPKNQEIKVKQELVSFKQYGNFDAFTRRFLSLLNQQNVDYCDSDKIFFFSNALRNDTAYEVTRSNVKTLTEAIDIATTFEQFKSKTNHVNNINQNSIPHKKTYNNPNDNKKSPKRFNNNNNRNNINKNNNNINYNNNKENNQINRNNVNMKNSYSKNNSTNQRSRPPNSHSDSQQRSSDYRKNTNGTNIQCYKCDEYGHKANNCPKRLNNISLGQNKQTSDNGSDHEGPIKDIGGTNVVSTIRYRSSPSRFASARVNILTLNDNSTNLAFVPGNIYGSRISALLDTGASVCTLSKTLAFKLNLHIDKDDSKIMMANNAETDILCVAKNINIKICGTTCSLDFLIIDSIYDAIIGIPWFEKVSAGLIFTSDGKRALRFDRRDYDVEILEHQINNISSTNQLPVLDEMAAELIPDDIEAEGLLDEHWEFRNQGDKIKTETALSKDQRLKFDRDITPIADRNIAKTLYDLNGCKLPPIKIEVEGSPVHVLPYRRSEKQRILEEKIVSEMLNAGLIRKSRSQWCQQVFVNAKGRLCLDSRPVNKITPKRSWPIPRIDDILASVSKATWFTKIDLLKGFWQLRLDEDSIPITAFATSMGKYEFIRLPFGMRNALFEFHRVLYDLLGDLPRVLLRRRYNNRIEFVR